MPELTIADLPEELRSRVRAATGQASYLRVQELASEPGSDEERYLVEAITSDRVTVMRLSPREGSVDEVTDSFVAADIGEVGDEAVVVENPAGRRVVSVTPETARAISRLLPRG